MFSWLDLCNGAPAQSGISSDLTRGIEDERLMGFDEV